MRSFNIFFVILISVVLYLLLSLISLHYFDYFVPEIELFNWDRNNIVRAIELIDTIETGLAIILIIILYFICFKIYRNKSYKPFLAIISNLLLIIGGVVYLLYWQTDFFYVAKTIEYGTYKGQIYYDHPDGAYHIFKWFEILILLTAVLFNIHFLTSIISKRKKYLYLILAFIPITSLFFLKFGPFLNSKRIWKEKV